MVIVRFQEQLRISVHALVTSRTIFKRRDRLHRQHLVTRLSNRPRHRLLHKMLPLQRHGHLHSINLVDSLINGRALSISRTSSFIAHVSLNFTKAHIAALQFSAALNSTLLSVNSGPASIKCIDDVPSDHKPGHYPVQNFQSASCVVETTRHIALNVFDNSDDAVSLNRVLLGL